MDVSNWLPPDFKAWHWEEPSTCKYCQAGSSLVLKTAAIVIHVPIVQGQAVIVHLYGTYMCTRGSYLLLLTIKQGANWSNIFQSISFLFVKQFTFHSCSDLHLHKQLISSTGVDHSDKPQNILLRNGKFHGSDYYKTVLVPVLLQYAATFAAFPSLFY